MSDAPLNDHLGTILSDFEAMRRSFTAEDEHGTHHFCPTSTVNSNFPCCPIKTEDGDEKGPCSSLFNQLLVSVHSSALQDTVLKNRKPNSVSFNNVNTANTKGHAWSGVKRVINCQRKLNPDVSSHTSDAESYHHNFHSLSSSLDYQVSSRINSPANSSQNLTGVNEQNVLDSATVMKTCTEGKMVNYDFKPSLVIASESININQCCKDVDLIFPNSRSPESGAPTNFAYSTSQLRWSPKCHNTKSFKSCSSFSSNQRAPKPESVKQFTQASFDPNSLGTKAQVISAEKLPSKSDCKISSLSALASSSVKGPSKEMLSIQNQRDRNKLLTSPGSCPDSNVKKSLVWNSLHQSPKLKPNLEELNFVTTRRPSQTIVPCEFEQEKAVKDCVGSVLQRVSTFPIANRPRPSGTQQDSYVEEDSVQQSEKLETALDTPRGLKTQVQMEESDTDAMENATCANNTGPEEYTQDHGLLSYVGIETVLDQMRRKAMKTGFEFNIMVVGQSGLGKSTLMNTLFKSKVSRKSCTPNYEEKIHQTVHLQSVSHVIEEKGVKLQLTIIDTPGFGDQINNENCWEPVVKYINEQYEKYLREELSINRKRRIPDTRVHCCVYFLPPTGHCLRPIDVEFMKRLGDIVSIVPVIAKADTLTIEERLEFRRRIQQDLQANGIRVYPQKEYDEDAEDRILNDKIREKIPFAVVGTDKEHQVNGNKVLGRKTKWGVIEVENVAHCEFTNFRDLLIRSHLQDLKDITHNIHYEAYRVRRLNDGNVNGLGRSSLMPLSNTMEEGGFGRQL